MLTVHTCLLTHDLFIDGFLCVLVMDIIDFGMDYSTILNMCCLYINIVLDNCEVIILRPVVKVRAWDKLLIIFIEY
jgi:hypothetical protein